MGLFKEIQNIANDIPDLDLSGTLLDIELMEKIGAAPIEMLMRFLTDLTAWRKENVTRFLALKPALFQLSQYLTGKERFVWEKVFTCNK